MAKKKSNVTSKYNNVTKERNAKRRKDRHELKMLRDFEGKTRRFTSKLVKLGVAIVGGEKVSTLRKMLKKASK